MDRVDCRVFEDQLDALARGDLPGEGMALLRGHATTCRDCAAQLRVREHLVLPSLQALELRVPDDLVSSMWPGVAGALEARGRRDLARPRWLVPALAAAGVVLLLGEGLALVALQRAEAREAALTEQLFDQQRRLVAIETPATSGRSGPAAGFAARALSFRSLGGREDVTVDALQAFLADLPGGTPVLSAPRARALAGARLLPPAWRDALGRLDTGREVTVEDLLAVLEDLSLPGDTNVPAARLFDLLS
ncbi:MAG TPA: zf-HC2 domain-containing protein [Longimicrobiales bacterium]|jgi:hypothetical protein